MHDCLSLLADIRNVAPVQGELIYALPFLGAVSFGFAGFFIMWFAFTCPRPAIPVIFSGGTLLVLMVYVFISADFAKYDDAFSWYDGILLPYYCVLQPYTYQGSGAIVALAVPSWFTIVATAAIPYFWWRYFRAKETP